MGMLPSAHTQLMDPTAFVPRPRGHGVQAMLAPNEKVLTAQGSHDRPPAATRLPPGHTQYVAEADANIPC